MGEFTFKQTINGKKENDRKIAEFKQTLPIYSLKRFNELVRDIWLEQEKISALTYDEIYHPYFDEPKHFVPFFQGVDNSGSKENSEKFRWSIEDQSRWSEGERDGTITLMLDEIENGQVMLDKLRVQVKKLQDQLDESTEAYTKKHEEAELKQALALAKKYPNEVKKVLD